MQHPAVAWRIVSLWAKAGLGANSQFQYW